MARDWRSDFEVWLAPFLAALRHKTRMRVCPAYIAGLIGPGDRKSVQPMATRDCEFGYDQLHHFVADGVWDSAPLEAVLLKEADRLVGDEAGIWSSTTQPCRRKAGIRSGWPRNMPLRLARPRTASPSFR
jgi:SRSO17 transposase